MVKHSNNKTSTNDTMGIHDIDLEYVSTTKINTIMTSHVFKIIDSMVKAKFKPIRDIDFDAFIMPY